MIPKKIHFIFGLKENFGNKPFSLFHYLAIKSAKVNNPDFEINYYFKYESSGEYWELLKKIANLIKIESPDEIFGNKLNHVAHKADVIRLELLKKEGGIYLDIDTITKKSFEPLLNEKCVIGAEGKKQQKLCNAIIFAEPDNKFINDWYDNYKSFKGTGKMDKTWGEHSIKLPAKMWKSGKYDDCLTVMPYTTFHYPLWDKKGTDLLFKECYDFPNVYCHHLWESFNWKYLSILTPEIIKKEDTTYNIIARKYL